MAPNDTTAEAFAEQQAVYDRLGPEGRVRLAVEMSEEIREVTRAGIRSRHPDYSAEEVEAALRRLIHGDELFRAAWPDSPVRDP